MFELRTKLVAYTIFVVLVVAGGLSAISITLDYRNASAAFERKINALAQTLAEAVVESVFVLDVRPLRQQVASVLTNKEAREAFILDADGRILTDGSDTNPSHGLRPADAFFGRVMTAKTWISETRRDGILVSGPILLTQDHVLGYVYLDFSTAELQARVLEQIRQNLVISSLFVIMTALLAIALAKRIISPINKLTRFASKISQGSRDRELPDCGGGEVGRLAKSFSEMLRKLDRSNQELISLADTLEQKVRDRTQAAEAGSRAKSEFLATMSHEIRTPMNGVLGMSSLLRETELDQDQQLYVETISESAEALLVIINDILDFSKIEAGKITLHEDWFDLKTLIDSILELLAHRAAHKDLEMTLHYPADLPTVFWGDAGRLRQLMMNLLGNAEKFTLSGSVTVRVTGEVSEATTALEIAVTDTGIGIPEDKQAEVFEGFSQVNASNSREFGGTGLGLSIAKDLAQLMGGSIQLHSIVGQGSTFTFRCQLKTDLENAAAALSTEPSKQLAGTGHPQLQLPNMPQTTPHLSDLKVLVADDNRTNRLLVEKMLQDTGCDIHFATDGQEAIDQFLHLKPDVVLMDISMPNLSGAEATQKIRSLEEARQWGPCQIHALTAHAMHGDRDRFLESGFSGYLSKPVRKVDLVHLLITKPETAHDPQPVDLGML